MVIVQLPQQLIATQGKPVKQHDYARTSRSVNDRTRPSSRESQLRPGCDGEPLTEFDLVARHLTAAQSGATKAQHVTSREDIGTQSSRYVCPRRMQKSISENNS